MTTGMDPKNINVARKTAIINNELLRLNVNTAALQETRLAGQDSIINSTGMGFYILHLLLKDFIF